MSGVDFTQVPSALIAVAFLVYVVVWAVLKLRGKPAPLVDAGTKDRQIAALFKITRENTAGISALTADVKTMLALQREREKNYERLMVKVDQLRAATDTNCGQLKEIRRRLETA